MTIVRPATANGLRTRKRKPSIVTSWAMARGYRTGAALSPWREGGGRVGGSRSTASAARRNSVSRPVVWSFHSRWSHASPDRSSPAYSSWPKVTPRNAATAKNAAASISTVRQPSATLRSTLPRVSR